MFSVRKEVSPGISLQELFFNYEEEK